jgi:hypothetical protein
VNSSILSFTSLGQKLSFALTIERIIGKYIDSASLVWDEGMSQVRSPIAVAVLDVRMTFFGICIYYVNNN